MSVARLPVRWSSPLPPDSCPPLAVAAAPRLAQATAQRLGLDSEDSAETIVQRGGRIPCLQSAVIGRGSRLIWAVVCPWIAVGGHPCPCLIAR